MTINAREVRKAMGDLIGKRTTIYNDKRKNFRRIKLYCLNAQTTNVKQIQKVFKQLGAYEASVLKPHWMYGRNVISIAAKFKY